MIDNEEACHVKVWKLQAEIELRNSKLDALQKKNAELSETVGALKNQLTNLKVTASPTDNKPVLWFKQLPEVFRNASGRNYEVVFVEVPGYEPLYSRP